MLTIQVSAMMGDPDRSPLMNNDHFVTLLSIIIAGYLNFLVKFLRDLNRIIQHHVKKLLLTYCTVRVVIWITLYHITTAESDSVGEPKANDLPMTSTVLWSYAVSKCDRYNY